MKIKRTNLLLTITCKDCGAIWFFNAIFGGVDIDAETTMTIAEAYERGDKIELLDNQSIHISECKCNKLNL